MTSVTTPCNIAAPAAAVSSYLPSRSDYGTTSAASTTSKIPAPCSAAPSISNHPLRSRQQLRPSLRIGGRNLRPDPQKRFPPVPRRIDHLDQGGLGYVARPLWQSRLAQKSAGQPRSNLDALGPAICRHFLPPPSRSRHAHGRVAGCARYRSSLRPCPLRWHFRLQREADSGSNQDF